MLEIDPAALIRETYDTEDVLRNRSGYGQARLVLYVDASEENRRLAKKQGMSGDYLQPR